MKKRILSVALVAIMTIMLFPTHAVYANNQSEWPLVTIVEIVEPGRFDHIALDNNSAAHNRFPVNNGGQVNFVSRGIHGGIVGGVWGFVDENGQIVIPLIYTYVSDFINEVSAVNIGGTWRAREGGVQSVFGGQWSLININGETIATLPQRYETMFPLGYGFFAFLYNDKWGVVNPQGMEITPARYDRVFPFESGFAGVANGIPAWGFFEGGEWGIIDKTGREVLQPIHGDVIVATDVGLALFNIGGHRAMDGLGWSGGRWGLFNLETNREIVPARYDGSWSWLAPYNDVIALDLNGRSRFINVVTGEEVAPFMDGIVTDFTEDGIAGLIRSGRVGLVDYRGRVLVEPTYYNIEPCYGGLFRVMRNERWGVIDKTGNTIIPVEFDFVMPFYNGLAMVNRQNQGVRETALFDSTGRMVVPFGTYDSFTTHNGFWRVNSGGNFGMLDGMGRVISPPTQGSNVPSYSDGIIRVSVRGPEVGYIDAVTGETLIPMGDFATGTNFRYGVAVVTTEAASGHTVINRTGGVVVPSGRYNLIREFHNGAAIVRNNNRWGFIDIQGNSIVSPLYTRVENFDRFGLARIYNDNGWGFVNRAGTEVLAPGTYFEIAPTWAENMLEPLNGFRLVRRLNTDRTTDYGLIRIMPIN